MSASESRVTKRVYDVLNIADGTYSATLSPRNKTRISEALTDIISESGLAILKAIAERPNEFRFPFLFDTTVTSSPTQMPEHIGSVVRVSIIPYDGGAAVEGKQAKYQEINSWRANPSKVYEAINHDAANSQLSGYYDVFEDRFYFTGYSATFTCARLPVRADNATLIPEILENLWVNLSVGNAAKVGIGGYEASIIGAYAQKGAADLNAFMAGERQFAEVQIPGTPVEVHN